MNVKWILNGYFANYLGIFYKKINLHDSYEEKKMIPRDEKLLYTFLINFENSSPRVTGTVYERSLSYRR